MDLRYFHHPPTYTDDSTHSLPVPDLLAVSGELAKELLLKNGYPEKKLVMVEALRYLYLLDLQIKKHHPKTLLIVTSYMREQSRFQLGILAQALTNLNFDRIWVKPHPFAPVEDVIQEMGMNRQLEVRRDHISSLLAESDVVFTCNDTAISIESAYLGIPTVSTISEGINMHPLLNLGVPLVSSPADLISFVKKPTPPQLNKNIFLLDKSLKMWKKVLEVDY
jgi:surface carbohydrate biosynthesis protein (TIGR04326 family)